MSNYPVWQFWWTVISGLANVVVWVGVWVCSKDKARSKDITDVKADYHGVDKRVTRLEENQIGHKDLGKVYDRINAVSDQMSAMKGELKGSVGGIAGSVDMILEHLLKKENGKQ